MTTDSGDSDLRVVVAGSGRLGLAVMQPLLESHHQVVGLIQNGRRVSPLERSAMWLQSRVTPGLLTPMGEAARHHVPVVWLEKLNDRELDKLRALEPDILVTCGFSIILPESVLNLPRIGCINVHTALLPKHRGPNPCAWVILDGDTESGVTIHVTDPGIDTGPILAQGRFDVTDSDTSMEVYLGSCAMTAELIVETVDAIEQHGFDHAQVQTDDESSYDPKIDEAVARVDWSKPAEEIDRLVRGVHAYCPAWFPHGVVKVKIAYARVGRNSTDAEPGTITAVSPEITVATGDGTIELVSAYTGQSRGANWPTFFSKLKPGMRLE